MLIDSSGLKPREPIDKMSIESPTWFLGYESTLAHCRGRSLQFAPGGELKLDGKLFLLRDMLEPMLKTEPLSNILIHFIGHIGPNSCADRMHVKVTRNKVMGR